MKLEYSVQTDETVQFVNIDHLIREAIEKRKIDSSICHVFVPHTTAGITINENADPDVVRDIIMETNRIVPFEDGYAHLEGNSAAHIKASLFGSSVALVIDHGRIQLGRWQSVFFCEFDGPRKRKIWISFSAYS